MIKKNINISINSCALAVEATEMKKSNSDNNTLFLYNEGKYFGSIDLTKYKFEFSWATDYTNHYKLIEK